MVIKMHSLYFINTTLLIIRCLYLFTEKILPYDCMPQAVAIKLKSIDKLYDGEIFILILNAYHFNYQSSSMQ